MERPKNHKEECISLFGNIRQTLFTDLNPDQSRELTAKALVYIAYLLAVQTDEQNK